MNKTSGIDNFSLHDFLLSYASFLSKRFRRIQDFIQLPADETARAFSFFIFNSQRYHPSFYEKYLSLEAREKELIKNVLLIAEKNREIKGVSLTFCTKVSLSIIFQKEAIIFICLNSQKRWFKRSL